MPRPCRSPAMPCRKVFIMCLSHLIYTVRPCLILTCHAVLRPCRSSQGYSTAVLCCGLEKNGMVGAWHGHGLASVNQTRSHCVDQMGKTHSKHLAARHGRGTAWARHAMCESAFMITRIIFFISFLLYHQSYYRLQVHLCHLLMACRRWIQWFFSY